MHQANREAVFAWLDACVTALTQADGHRVPAASFQKNF